jgi:hypothetical protein
MEAFADLNYFPFLLISLHLDTAERRFGRVRTSNTCTCMWFCRKCITGVYGISLFDRPSSSHSGFVGLVP